MSLLMLMATSSRAVAWGLVLVLCESGRKSQVKMVQMEMRLMARRNGKGPDEISGGIAGLHESSWALLG
jgi:hypothetical protein